MIGWLRENFARSSRRQAALEEEMACVKKFVSPTLGPESSAVDVQLKIGDRIEEARQVGFSEGYAKGLADAMKGRVALRP